MPVQYNEGLDDPKLVERVESFGGGMDAFLRSTLLAADVSQYLENVVVLDNLEARTRPGVLTLGAAIGASVQGLRYFDTTTYEQLIGGADGKLWYWATPFAAWVEMTGFALSDGELRVEMAQGVDKVLISDGVQNMRSWDGAAFVDLGNVNLGVSGDPPVGATVLCWHGTRMFASGKSTLSDTVWASALLDFGSGNWDHTQFSFRVGGGEGDPIVALASLQDFNLCILKENSVWLYNTPPEAATAAEWTSRKLSVGSGCAGKHAWALCDNDIYYMARGEGVRMVSRMQAAAGQYDVSPPLSRPMQPYVDRINWTKGHLIEAHAYKHLVFFAVPLDSSTYNNYVMVYNRRLQRWTGIWTNLRPLAFETTRFAGVQRLVMGEQTGTVRQWKDYADVADDATYLDDAEDIPTKLWSRSFQFAEMFNDKAARDIEARFSSSNAVVTLILVGDNAELRTWTQDVTGSGPDLPVDLPFDLWSPATIRARRGLRGLQRFNEAYVKLESTSGWWAMRSLTLAAYSKRMPTLTE